MATGVQETKALLLKDKEKNQGESCQFIIATASGINSFLRGASSYAATFSRIAITWDKGLWLIAPIGFGATISLSNEAVAKLAKRYPDNKFLKALNSGTFFAAQGAGGFFADFGFAWNMINTLGAYISGVELVKTDGYYNKFIAPSTAAIPAIMASRLAYIHKQNKLIDRSFMRHAAHLAFGLNAPGGYLGMLEQQAFVDPESFTPTAVILASGTLALLSSLLKETHPKISRVLLLIVNLLAENPSLAATLFHFPNDIYAAENNDEISEPFFFTTVGVSGAFLLLLTTLSVYSFLYPETPQESAAFSINTDIESIYPADTENNDLHSDDDDVIPQPRIFKFEDINDLLGGNDNDSQTTTTKLPDVDSPRVEEVIDNATVIDISALNATTSNTRAIPSPVTTLKSIGTFPSPKKQAGSVQNENNFIHNI
ncbi:Uncharacterised protein [Legionella beliardensis]|uniref:Uncharacterized protein n=1 Tax=Legionella beliardensis TaxID=91822 RepID=A0A378I1Q2_9GAMM|nr:hypothetical protein [Legionella beliardensis]STX28566.1 Uncharacterised protein [Legionella beliardensis]